MIERNIGPIERVLRLIFAIMLIGWVFSGKSFGVAQGAALVAAMALTWNSIFARCYLWKWIGVTSCPTPLSSDTKGGEESGA